MDRQTNIASPFYFGFRLHIARLVSLIIADETGGGGGEAGTNYRDPAVRKGARGPCMLKMFFVFLFSIIIWKLHKLTLSDLRPFNVKVFRGPAELWGPQKFLSWGPKPLSGRLSLLTTTDPKP